MAVMNEVRWSLASSLVIVTLLSCGEPSGSAAAFRQAAAADVSPAKGGEPARALPSTLVPGEVAGFRSTSGNAGPRKNLERAGSLPSHAAAGKGAVYSPAARPASGFRAAAGQDGER